MDALSCLVDHPKHLVKIYPSAADKFYIVIRGIFFVKIFAFNRPALLYYLPWPAAGIVFKCWSFCKYKWYILLFRVHIAERERMMKIMIFPQARHVLF